MDCEFCSYEFPAAAVRCPHCGRPGNFPNVRASQSADEKKGLADSLASARALAGDQGVGDLLESYEAAVGRSYAVLNRPISATFQLVQSQNELYGSYYQLVSAGLKLADTDIWNKLRVFADRSLFPGYEADIKFAALSLEYSGVANYGDCCVVLRSEMIAHRSTAFYENSVRWLRARNPTFEELATLPVGYRASWEDRGVLAAIKAVNQGRLDSNENFSDILLAETHLDEIDFVEVHVWGPLTIRSVQHIALQKTPTSKADRAIWEAVKERALALQVGTS